MRLLGWNPELDLSADKFFFFFFKFFLHDLLSFLAAILEGSSHPCLKSEKREEEIKHFVAYHLSGGLLWRQFACAARWVFWGFCF